MKTVHELKSEAHLEAKAAMDLEKLRLTSYIESAIKDAILGVEPGNNLCVWVTVPGYHLYKRRGEPVFSEPLREVLEECSLMGVDFSVDWNKIGADKQERSQFLVTVPSTLLEKKEGTII